MVGLRPLHEPVPRVIRLPAEVGDARKDCEAQWHGVQRPAAVVVVVLAEKLLERRYDGDGVCGAGASRQHYFESTREG
jgi:hypothetical protein